MLENNKKDYTVILETKNLKLRKFVDEDYIGMFENWASNPNVANRAGWPTHKSIESTKKLVKMWVLEYTESDNVFNWIIEEKKSNNVIGSITVVSKDLRNCTCEIGYNIGEKWWNNGYGTEAINKVLDYLFSLNLFNVITANCFDDNIASKRVLEKNNFVYEGLLRNRIMINNQPKNLLQFSIMKSEFVKHE